VTRPERSSDGQRRKDHLWRWEPIQSYWKRNHRHSKFRNISRSFVSYRLDDVDSRSDPPLCRDASNCSSFHLFGRFSSPSGLLSVFDQASRFLSKTQIWEDYCNRPDDVDSCLDALIHKASIAIQIQTYGRQTSRSGSASIRYGNCVHQISHPDGHPPGPNARSLYMEITCSRRATVWMTGHHRLDEAQLRKEFQ